MHDSFSQAIGDRRGTAGVAIAPSSSPEARARQLVLQLTEEPATSRTSTPAERLHAAIDGFELSANELATRPVCHGLLCVFELAGRFSASDPQERLWRGLLVWREGAGWELFERAVAVAS
jgi:hypothetical protein